MVIPDLRAELAKRAMRRELVDRLKYEIEVSSTRMHHNKITVFFRDGIRENWVHDRVEKTTYNYIIPPDPYEGGPISIRTEYLFNDLDNNAEQMRKLFCLNGKQWYRSNFYEQRLVVHKLIYQIISEGWVDIDFHHLDLTKDLERLTNVSLKQRHFWDGILHVYGRYHRYPGKMLVEQFTDWNYHGELTLKEAWTKPAKLYRAIRKLLRYSCNITRHNILCAINGLHIGPKYICPNVYRTLFRLFGCNGYVIADPYPGFGTKAIAATLAECEYHSPTPFRRLAAFLGTEFYALDRDRYDCVLLDYHWRDPGDVVMEDLEYWADKADIRIVFVPRLRVRQFPKPDKYVKILTRSTGDTEDTNFVFYYV